MSKRGSTGLCGVLAIDKPASITSHDVVDRVRRITGERRVGHAGTLDPMATGLMLVGVGAATRLSQYLTGHDKSYRARILFGASTDTDDAEGRMLTGEAFPGALSLCNSSAALADGALACLEDEAFARETVAALVGEVEQLPPAYSAIKKNGVTAYKAAREGKALELERRKVTICSAELIEIGCASTTLRFEENELPVELPYWDIELSVSKGTYIRSIARDLGVKLGCGAHLGALRRESIAHTSVADAVSLDELDSSFDAENISWCDPAQLLDLPVHAASEAEATFVANGRGFNVSDMSEGDFSCVREGKLLGLYHCDGEGRAKPVTVIAGGVAGVR